MPLLKESSEAGDAVEVLELSYAYTIDSFVAWRFGNLVGSNLIGDEKKERRLYLKWVIRGGSVHVLAVRVHNSEHAPQSGWPHP